MSVIDLQTEDFEQHIATHETVFIDFWAEWCAPCKHFSVVYDKVAEKTKNPKVSFAKVNLETEQELADLFEIRSIPHLMVFKKGIIIYSDSGSMPESTLTDLVEQAIAADVSDLLEE